MCPAGVSSAAVLVCMDWRLHLEIRGVEVENKNFSQRLRHSEMVYLVSPGADCCVAVWSERSGFWSTLSEGFYFASAFGDSRAFWACSLWEKTRLREHQAPRSHPKWNPRVLGRLQILQDRRRKPQELNPRRWIKALFDPVELSERSTL